MTKDYVTLAVQAGSIAANTAVAPYYMRMRQLLAEKCSRVYGSDIEEFAFVLRIDGSMVSWHKCGCGNLRVGRESRAATIDIFIPEKVWESDDQTRVKLLLLVEISKGFSMMLERAIEKGMKLDSDTLSSDFELALEEFRIST